MKLATAYVEVRSDTGKAEADVRSFVTGIVRQPAELRITADGSAATSEAKRVASAVGAISSEPINITADGSQAESEARDVGRSIGAIEPDAINITADGSQAEGEAKQTGQVIDAIDPPPIPIEADDQTTPVMARIQQRIAGLTDSDKEIVLKAAADQAEAEIKGLNKQLASLDGDDATVILKARDETQKTFDQINKEMDQLPKGAQSAAAGMTANFVRFFSAAIIVDQLKKAGQAASDLEQQVGGTEAVFKSASDTIGAYAKNAAETLGLSERDFRQYSTLIGGSLKQIGEPLDETAAKTIRISELAADLAATYGGTTKTAVEAIGSTFRGEFDSIEQFNVAMKQSEVNAKAVALGLAESETAVSNSARIQATYALLLEKTGDAQGQFAAQSGTAGEQAQIAAAKFDNAQAKLGSALLPVFARAAEIAGTLADAFAALPGPVQTAVVAIAGIAIIAGPIKNAITSIKGLSTALEGATGTALLANPAFLAIATLGTIVAKLGQQYGATSLDIDSLNKALVDGVPAVDAVNQNLTDLVNSHQGLAAVFKAAGTDTLGVAQAFTQGGAAAEDMSKRLLDAGRNAGISFGDMDALLELVGEYPAKFKSAAESAAQVRDVTKETGDAAAGSTAAIDAVVESISGFDAPARAAGDAASATADSLGKMSSNMAELKGTTVDYAAIAKEQNEELANTKSTADEAAEAIDAFAAALDKAFGSATDLQAAQDEVRQQTEDLTKAVTDNGATLDENTEKGRTNRAQVRDSVTGIQDYIKKLAESGATSQEVKGQYDFLRAGLVSQLTQFGLTEAEADQYIDTLGLTPKSVTTAIELQNQQTAKAQVLDYLNNSVEKIPSNVRTAIQAALDAGDFIYAKQLVDNIPRNVSVKITASTAGFTASQMAAFNKERGAAVGAFIPGGSARDVSWSLAEKPGRSGDEAVLPLGDLPRMKSLLSDPRIGPRVAAALDGGGGAVAVGGGTHVGTIVAADPRAAIIELERRQWQAERANQLGQVYR